MKSIFLANLSEVALPLVHLLSKKRADDEIYEDHALCDRFLFQDQDDCLLITPFPIDPEFKFDSCNMLRLQNVVNLYPSQIQSSLCEAVLSDEKVLSVLLETIRKNPGISIRSYVSSPQFLAVIDFLKSNDLLFLTPEMPNEESRWTTSFFDSKAGFRQTVPFMEHFPKMPLGAICKNESEIIGWALFFLRKHKGFVLKANDGLAGAGLKIIKHEDVLLSGAKVYIRKVLQEEPWFTKGLTVVEEYIPPHMKVCGGAPNIELRADGKNVSVLYTCGMRITKDGVFKGVEIGREAVPKKIDGPLRKAGDGFGNYIRNLGYQGFFEIDWVLGMQGELMPIEANLRRTGGTHVYELAKRLLGENFAQKYYVAATNIQRSDRLKSKTYEQIKDILSPVLFPLQNKKEGVVITCLSYLTKGNIGYAVIAPSRKRAELIEKKFLQMI